ncbi:hypothetical protein AJ79_09127 [Helicocarpus griseus UAMH5409]|uniref:Metallo-beta-lactamase domain-containing protein n=1 Tax=Helicocarpus griseus UAMH5409 TaxID=1447875 RepID=A0A2B7WMA3_9EURO|nr:hypothetical protein AJ79_09127 [Helicocarpus griseus UAMH5409]
MSAASFSQVHKPASNDAVIQLTLLSGGHIHLRGEHFVQGSDETLICPSMSWLLTHKPTDARLIFDLGLRKDAENYIPPVAERIRTRVTISVDEDVFDSLAKANVDPTEDIDAVIFSHLHYDHVGDPSRFFGTKTKFIVGPGAIDALLSGPNTYPSDPESIFDSNLLPKEQTIELPSPAPSSSPSSSRQIQPPSSENMQKWQPLGPFPAAMDYFGDGSVFIIDAPGHLAGHLNLLVRVAPEKWMYLAGDTAHDVRVYKGARELAVYPDPKREGHFACAHADKEAAREHMLRVRKLDEGEKVVEVVLAHDFGWFETKGMEWRLC